MDEDAKQHGDEDGEGGDDQGVLAVWFFTYGCRARLIAIRNLSPPCCSRFRGHETRSKSRACAGQVRGAMQPSQGSAHHHVRTPIRFRTHCIIRRPMRRIVDLAQETRSPTSPVFPVPPCHRSVPRARRSRGTAAHSRVARQSRVEPLHTAIGFGASGACSSTVGSGARSQQTFSIGAITSAVPANAIPPFWLTTAQSKATRRFRHPCRLL